MQRSGQAALMRIYTDERAKADGSPLFTAVVERARKFPIAGATVLRAVAGFGESGSVQRASILDLAANLPLVIELVDDEHVLRAFWETLAGLTDIGLVTLEALEVLHYGGKEQLGP
jgi:uncharacterized protein